MLTAKAAIERSDDDIEIVAVNDLMPMESLALLFKRDTVHGIWPESVELDGNVLRVGDREIKTFAERDPSAIPWGDVGADVIVESTGVFTDGEKGAAHIEGGADRKSTRLNSSHANISYAVFCLKKKTNTKV